MTDKINLSPEVAAGLTRIGIGDFGIFETPERMAWVMIVMSHLPDRPSWFPRGKWETIRYIAQRVFLCAEDESERLVSGE